MIKETDGGITELEAAPAVCALLNLFVVRRQKYRNIVRHEDYKYVEKSLQWLETSEAQKSIKERRCYAEWAIAEAKNLYGLSKTPY